MLANRILNCYCENIHYLNYSLDQFVGKTTRVKTVVDAGILAHRQDSHAHVLLDTEGRDVSR